MDVSHMRSERSNGPLLLYCRYVLLIVNLRNWQLWPGKVASWCRHHFWGYWAWEVCLPHNLECGYCTLTFKMFCQIWSI